MATKELNFEHFDADSHVQEIGGSWELYLDEKFAHRRPQVIERPMMRDKPYRDKAWYIDGELTPKFEGNGAVVMSTPCEMEFARKKPVPIDVQSCIDPTARANTMKECGVDRTVLFSTLFLQSLTNDLVYEAALMRAWNSWMADQCSQVPNILNFAALVPFRDPQLAIEEMVLAKKKGATTVMLLPTAGERFLHDPIFDPFWSEAQDLNMPISIHIGWGSPRTTNECTSPACTFLGAFDISVWWAYISVLAGGIFDKFKDLKISFIEHDARFFQLFMQRAMHWFPTSVCKPWPGKKSPEAYLKEHQIYFTYEGDFNYLPDFLKLVGEDRVMGAFDFPHTHYGVASLSAAFDFIRDHNALSFEEKRKLLHDNAAKFYNWT